MGLCNTKQYITPNNVLNYEYNICPQIKPTTPEISPSPLVIGGLNSTNSSQVCNKNSKNNSKSTSKKFIHNTISSIKNRI